jgi:hypothetical protein
VLRDETEGRMIDDWICIMGGVAIP